MELDQPVDEQAPKKHRHRKKLLYNSILQQMEFYFGDSNLSKDRYLGQLTQNDPFVDLSVFLQFNKIRKLTTNVEHIANALKKSEVLELSEDNTKVKRKTPLKLNENVDDCTIYVEKIKPDATHDWLASIFSEFGTVVYVSIPKYHHNKLNKGFAFVEFKSEGEARQVLEHFESIGCKMSSQMTPEELCSIATYENEKTENENRTNGENDAEEKPDEVGAKRKHSEDSEGCDEARDNKKLKGDDVKTSEGVLNESNAENEDGDDKKKKKTKKAKKKPSFKELGLQILSKHEWKKMRNRYLDMQRKKMKQLKQFLNKRKFSSARFDDYRQRGQDNSEKKEPPSESPKLQFVPGVIVKMRLPEVCAETKKLKAELKTHSDQIKFVDVQVGSEEAYLRFGDNESAKKFCGSKIKGESCVLEGEDERAYWEKIHESNSIKSKKDRQKQRGRDKLLKKAERELGKHIRFDDTD